MKSRVGLIGFRISALLLFLGIQIQAQDIHHNLPDNLEIIDPKTLGLSGTDLEKFLGNVKLLPMEGAFGGSGSPKAQILTVGFDGSEQLNLQDFESLSTAGLPEADKHVAEMAFKKFQTFFRNPHSAQDFDETTSGRTTEHGDAAYQSTTPSTSSASTTYRAMTPKTNNVKHHKRVRVGKRPIFSSTFRSVPSGEAEIGTTTERVYHTQSHPISQMRPITEGGRQYYQHQHQDLQIANNLQQSPLQHQFVGQMSPTYQPYNQVTETQLWGQGIQPNIQGNYHLPPAAQTIGTQPVNVIHQMNYNFETSTPTSQGGQTFQPHHEPRLVLQDSNQNALRASQHNQHQYPYVAKQQQFTLRPKQNPGPYPSVKPEYRNPEVNGNYQQSPSQFQHSQHSATIQSQIPIVNVNQHVSQFPQAFQSPVGPEMLNNGGAREYEFQHQQQQQNRFVSPTTPTQHRQQKQIPVPTSPVIGNYQQEVRVSQGQAQNPGPYSQGFNQQHHNFNKIQQHRVQNQGFRQSEIRPSQVDPLPSQELNHAVPSYAAPVQAYKTPKRIRPEKVTQQLHYHTAASPNGLFQHQPQQSLNQFQRYPPPPTPKSVSMSGVVQITPSTPLIPLSTVENAMTAHKSIMQMNVGNLEFGQNQIPGSSEPFHESPEIKPSFQHSTRFQQASQFSPQNVQHSPAPAPLPVQGRRPLAQQFPNSHLQQRPFPRPLPRRPPMPPPPAGFRQDPIPGEGQPSFPHFMPEPSRHISAPLPPGEFSDYSQPIGANQFAGNGFNFREQKSYPGTNFQGSRNPPYALQNQSPHITHRPVGHRFNRIHLGQMPTNQYDHQFPQAQPHELRLELAPPHPHNLKMPVGNGRFPQREDPRFHSEANNYATSLGLNIQSINSAPLIGAFNAP